MILIRQHFFDPVFVRATKLNVLEKFEIAKNVIAAVFWENFIAICPSTAIVQRAIENN